MNPRIFSAVLLFFLHSCYALECYSCSAQIGLSNNLNDCEYFSYSDYDNHKKSTCMSGDEVCAKYTVYHDGVTWVHRNCKQLNVCTFLKTIYSTGQDNLIECTTCSDRDLCNSSMPIAGSVLAFVAICLFLMLNTIF